uniref:Uncharacterized protein n=1 Tax=Oryza glumipatula TaxID=40148 RepID=A0A0E0ATI1_9ORYZ
MSSSRIAITVVVLGSPPLDPHEADDVGVTVTIEVIVPGLPPLDPAFTRPPAPDLAIVRPPVVEEPRHVAAALVGPYFHYKIHPSLATPVTDKMGKE